MITPEKDKRESKAAALKNKNGDLTCKLTTAEFRERESTIIAGLKKHVLAKKELRNGFAYKFKSTDKMIDELTTFIKVEKECCNFLFFQLTISGNKNEIWMQIKGPDGVKDFIKAELMLP